MSGLLAIILTSGVWIGLLVYFATHPDNFKKWASIISNILSYIWKKYRYTSIKWNIEGKVNSFISNLETQTSSTFPRVVIRWQSKDGEGLVWEDEEVIIIMKDRDHNNKNFVHASYFFISQTLLRKSKVHLSKTQKISLDLFATKKLLESESRSSVEQFMTDYFVPEVEKNDGVRSMIKQCTDIDRLGVFFPILINELNNLGNKVFLEKPTNEVFEEVKALIKFLEDFSFREVGDMTVADTFIGKYTRCAIKIIASKKTREDNNIEHHLNRISRSLELKLENIYIIGNSRNENKKFMHSVVASTIDKHGHVEVTKTCDFNAKILFPSGMKPVDTHLVCLHNPVAVKYIYTKEDLVS